MVNRDLLPKNTPPEICQRLEQLRRELSANQRFIESLDGNILAAGIDPDSPQSRSAGAVNLPIDSINQIRETLVQQKQELNQVLEQIKDFDLTFEYTQRVQRINLSEIPALLPEKTALVEWFIASERIYAFIVWADSPQPLLRQAQGIALEKGEKDDQSSFRADYWQSKPEAVTELGELRDRYLETYNSKTDIWENQLEPFLEELAEILNIQYILSKIPAFCQRLILVPYRELHLFPLHALPVAKENGKTLCLFDQFSQGVQYLPSLQMGLMSLENIALREEKPDNAVNNIQLFAIQNPTEDLDFAELEVDAIASQFTANTLSREKATKIALTQPPNSDLFRDANYLHFACHGSFNFEFPLLSHLILAGGIVEVFQSSDRQTQEELDPPKTKRYLSWRKGKQVDTDQCYTLREIFSLDFPKGETGDIIRL
ncbi:MAG: CHAT domain-containing protein [Planktothrix sp. GU0601_MAG3]|nr:MAG: CHAT domain-containing protein [Planktothrix sp. GU0601_MAG3]